MTDFQLTPDDKKDIETTIRSIFGPVLGQALQQVLDIERFLVTEIYRREVAFCLEAVDDVDAACIVIDLFGHQGFWWEIQSLGVIHVA